MFQFAARIALTRAVILVMACLVLSPTSLVAQNQPPGKPNQQERNLARNYARGRVSQSPEAEAALRKDLRFQMSLMADAKKPEASLSTRRNIYTTYLTAMKNPSARKVIVAELSALATRYVAGEYSPQTKINSVALLAELDDIPAAGGNPPMPSQAAFRTLFGIAKSERFPVYLRAIALHGLERQIGVKWARWDGDARGLVGLPLMKIADSEPKSALDLESHAWLVRRAYDCLALTGAPVVTASATRRLADPGILPSLRMTAASYLCAMDSSKLSPEQKTLYSIGLAHFLRSQLVNWYEREEDIIKRDTGAAAGMMGGMGGMMGGGYGGGGEDEMMGGGMGGGFGGGGYGDEGGAGSTVKPIETQTWQTLLARRRVNQIMQVVHRCLNGLPTEDARKPENTTSKSLDEAGLPPELQAKIAELTTALDALQTAVNNADKITDVSSLLTEAQIPIEDIMDLVLEIPGFAAQYPDLAEGQELEAVPEQPPADAVPSDAGQDAALPDATDPADATAVPTQP